MTNIFDHHKQYCKLDALKVFKASSFTKLTLTLPDVTISGCDWMNSMPPTALSCASLMTVTKRRSSSPHTAMCPTELAVATVVTPSVKENEVNTTKSSLNESNNRYNEMVMQNFDF